MLLAICVLAVAPAARADIAFYPGQYYGGATTPEASTPIVLRPGERSSDLEFELQQSGGEIRGRLVGNVGGVDRPLFAVWVEAVVGNKRMGVFSGTDGSFRLGRVPAGPVLVRYSTDAPGSRYPELRAIWHGGLEDSTAVNPIPLIDGRIIDFTNVRIPAGSLISGDMLGDETTPLPRHWVRVIKLSATDPRTWTTRTDAKGHWVQGGLSGGLYKVLASTEGTEYIPEYYGGSRELSTATVINLGDTQQLTNLVLAPDLGGSISGQVLETNAGPAVGLTVEAIRSTDHRHYSAVTNELGIYEVKGLPTGTYYVYIPAMYKYYPDSPTERGATAVRVTEQNGLSGIDIGGRIEAPCTLSSGSAGAISGTVQADFSAMSRAVIEAYNATEVLRQVVTATGGYAINCVPAGTYRVVFRPDGPYRTQYHEKTNFEANSTAVLVTPPDSVLRVDFKPDRSVELTGVLSDKTTHLAIIGGRIWAREDTSGVVATGVTDQTGSFLLSRLGDGSGLPAGRWIVRAESTLIMAAQPTPAMQPSLDCAVSGAEVEIRWGLTPEYPWSLAIERVGFDSVDRIVELGETRGDGSTFDRPPTRGPYVYRLRATTEDENGPREFTIESPAVELVPARKLLAHPNPWSGGAALTFRWEDGAPPLRESATLRLFGPDGREVAATRWAAATPALEWSALDLASGRYFYRLEAAGARYQGTVVVQR